ncbi:MAG: hypothetical protein COV31_01715 [Candidatus Yanofskybacteria bacterium CG10_big_fil_rev_8_21_14_0_10_46_23]|uniref:Uncharacterized protein n=1 Tax=Candidatus Yanofskybacteria bacterium CG10_big_fil_rev_8_21_14_0_10_46_23 TaxID=1975098 RepID=A0A2H0R5L7_9BACT|nr:MAG: hypothetical protein COV31_01715 [Candidatus Yanofskybacteria bacterium CG10_big_fil_rev_8_21_14_0_10_46_23]
MRFEGFSSESEYAGQIPASVREFYRVLGILLGDEGLDLEDIEERFEEKYHSDISILHEVLDRARLEDKSEVSEALDYGERITRSAIDIERGLPDLPTLEEFAGANPHAMISPRFEDMDMEEAIKAFRELDDDQEIWVFVGMDREAAEKASIDGIRIGDKDIQDGPPDGAPGRGVSSGLYVAAHPSQAGWYATRHRGNSRTSRPMSETGVVAIRTKKRDLQVPPEAGAVGSSVGRFATPEGEPIDTAEALVNAKYGAVITEDIDPNDIIYVSPRRRSESDIREHPADATTTWEMDGYSAISHPVTGDRRTHFLQLGRLRHNN